MGQLVLSRQLYQSITVAGPCKITVCEISHNRVRLGIEADKAVAIIRDDAKNPLPNGSRQCDIDSGK